MLTLLGYVMVVFFQIPNYSQKVHNGSKNASCFKAYEAIFVIVGIYTIWLFVRYLPNKWL